MKVSVLATAAIAQVASAHYFFDKAFVGDKQVGQPLEYIRKNTRSVAYMPTKWKNTFDNLTPDKDDFRCNLGAFQSAANTKVLEVKAGDTLAMGLGVGATMKHPGPAFVYMSKAPGDVTKYEGDGDWFKIFQSGICNKSGDIKGTAWCTWDKDRITFKIPEATPKGEFLIRSEHIGVHGAHDGQAEFYYGCMQIRITEGGNGTPDATYKFPGAYKVNDPAVNFSVWGGMKDYPFPGSAPWTGAGGSSTPAKEPTSPATSPAASPVAAAPATSSSPAPATEPATGPADDYAAGSGAGSGAAPAAGKAAVHNDENCNSGKNKRGRRAFRDSLRKAE